jgi:hypothetical protein
MTTLEAMNLQETIQWVPVKKRKPDHYMLFLAKVKNSGVVTSIYLPSGFFHNGKKLNATHWAEMPKGPK